MIIFAIENEEKFVLLPDRLECLERTYLVCKDAVHVVVLSVMSVSIWRLEWDVLAGERNNSFSTWFESTGCRAWCVWPTQWMNPGNVSNNHKHFPFIPGVVSANCERTVPVKCYYEILRTKLVNYIFDFSTKALGRLGWIFLSPPNVCARDDEWIVNIFRL